MKAKGHIEGVVQAKQSDVDVAIANVSKVANSVYFLPCCSIITYPLSQHSMILVSIGSLVE